MSDVNLLIERLLNYELSTEYYEATQEAASALETLSRKLEEKEAEIGRLKADLIEQQARIKELESDHAIHFCHRFAVVLECMLVADTSSSVWDEATTLLSEYHEAQDKWREMMGEPYVSGFGKD